MQRHSKFRLLVVRLGAMGDILHALPAVTALREIHPDWTIDWVVEPQWSALLAAHGSQLRTPGPGSPQPIVDRLHFAPTKVWRRAPLSGKTLAEIVSLRGDLRAAGYDAVLDLQGLVRSAIIGRMTGCPLRIGPSEPRERIARCLYTERVSPTSQHVIEQAVELASAVAGDQLEPIQPLLPADPAAESWADQILPAGGPPAVLINPGAGWGAKRWPVQRYTAVARQLAAHGCRVLINAGPGEEDLASALVRGSGNAVLPLSCSVAQLIAVTRRLSLAIAGDTGPLHLACVLGIPVVGIFGPTDPDRNGPYGVPFRVLRSPESRRDHTRRPEPEAGLLTITPEAVLAAAGELLNFPD